MLKSIKSFSKRTVSVVLSLMIILSTTLVSMLTTTAANNCYIRGTMNGWNESSNWQLTYDSDNHYYGTYYINSGSSYSFKIYDSNWYGTGSATSFSSSYTAGSIGYANTGNVISLSTMTSSSNYVKLMVDFWTAKDNNAPYLKIEQSAVTALGASLTVSDNSLKKGEKATLTPSATGGSGGYTYSYKVTNASGTDVTSSVLSGNTFTAPSVTADTIYTVTVTAKDSHALLSGLSSATSSKTITVEKDAYTVSATAKVQTFNVNTNSYNAVTNATSSQGTATASPTSVTPGSETTLTATAKTGYTFAGWYSNSTCTTLVSEDAEYVVTPNSSTTYYALFKQDYTTKELTVANNNDATVTVTYNGKTYAEGSTVTIPVGATVTVNVTGIADGKYCSVVKAGTITATPSGSSYTFTMPSSDVSVVATIADKTPATVTVSSNDNTLGTATATPSTDLYVGDTVTLKAQNGTGSFSKWTISGANITTSTDATVTVTITSPELVATATFADVTYQVAIEGSSISMIETSTPGVYISTSKLTNGYWFTIKKIQNNTSTYAKSSESREMGLKADTIASVQGWKTPYVSNSNVYANYAGSNMYVVYDTTQGTNGNGVVYLSDNAENKRTYKIYAKNGTIRYQGDASFTTTADSYGSTVVSGAGTGEQISPGGQGESGYRYTLYKTTEGTNIKITTTVASSYDKVGYYVWAFCVNGKYVEATKDVGTTYIGTYTITAEEAVNNSFEITPIYLNTNIRDKGDYVTFYFDAGDVTGRWGQTIAVYPYGDNAPFEDYPGQPLVLRGKYYTIMVPKVIYNIDASKGTVSRTSNELDGLTLNSYTGDNIHHQILYGNDEIFWKDNTNFQTYDFADFIELAKDPEIKTIMFESKYFSHDDGKDNGAVSGTNTKITVPSGGWDAVAVNPFETFTDYYGTPTDVLGNILSESDKAKDPIYVISEGNKNTYNSGSVTVGKWATEWYIYDHNGNYLTSGTPADFLRDNTFSNTNRSLFINRPTYISYDREEFDESGDKNDHGIRSDGRWYYSRLGMEFKSSVAIEYTDASGANITLDENTNADENTGFVGKTTDGSKATINGMTEATFTTVDSTPTISVNVADGWAFDGWYIREVEEDGTVEYIEIGSTTTLTNFIMNNSYTIVARLRPILEGSLVLTHSQYTGSDPAYHTGTGDYYISAVVKDGNTIISSVEDSKTPITIPALSADYDYTIDITLRTVCHGDNTFYAWYELDNGKYFEIAGDEDPRGQSEVSYSFTLNTDMLFGVDNSQLTKRIDFFSDIIKVSAYCDITYKYYDRFEVNGSGTMVSYVVRNIELSNDEIKAGYIPTDDKISKYAPEIDTMYVDTEWEISDSYVVKGKSVVEVTAKQNDKICKVIAPSNLSSIDNPEDLYYGNAENVVFNSWFVDDEGNFKLTAPKTIGDYSFTRWEVYKLDEQGEDTGELVTVLSDRIFTLRIMADYKLVPVYNETPDKITAHISAPVLNREIYGDSTNPTDKLYVDFLVAFTSTDIPVFKENTTDYTVECGVIVDRNNTLKLSAEDRAAIIAAANSKNAADPTETYLLEYKKSFEADYSKISEVAFDSQYGDKAKVTYTYENQEHRLSKYVLDNDQLTNKNRIDKVLTYTNNEDNQNYIFAAYSYVIIRDASGETVASAITTTDDAQFYNLCYKGNEPYEKTTS